MCRFVSQTGDNPSSYKVPVSDNQTSLEEASHDDAVAESRDHWLAARETGRAAKEANKDTPPTRRHTLKELRRDLSWAAREMGDQKKGGKWNVRKRRRRVVLLRWLGQGSRGNLGRKSLHNIRAKLRGMLKIKLAREKMQKTRDARRKAQEEFAARGPRNLRPKQEEMNHVNVAEVEIFWGRIWEVRGRYQPGNAAVAKWSTGVGHQATGTPGDMAEGRETGWRSTVRKMAGWRAP